MKKSDLSLKKQPVQQRSMFLVETLKEAATRVLKEQGVAGFNTNAVAERAGVSIGSLYQYYGSKEVLIAEIKRDHFAQLRGFFQQAQAGLKTGELKELVDAFVDASVKGHQVDPELHRILSQDLGHFEIKEKDDSSASVLQKVKQAMAAYQSQMRSGLDLDTASELVYHLVEKTVHGAVLDETDLDKQQRIIAELKTMVLIYLTQ